MTIQSDYQTSEKGSNNPDYVLLCSYCQIYYCTFFWLEHSYGHRGLHLCMTQGIQIRLYKIIKIRLLFSY